MIQPTKYRLHRIKVATGGRVLFWLPVGMLAEGAPPAEVSEHWRQAWFHAWVCLPDLLDEPGPFSLVVESSLLPVPRPIAEDANMVEGLYQPTYQRHDLTLGQLGGAVLRYLGKVGRAGGLAQGGAG